MSEKTNKPSMGFWKDAKALLNRPVRARSGVNLLKLSKSTKEGQTVLVADKILGDGYISHKITVAALGFSQRARSQIEAVGGKVVSIDELKKSNPSGDGLQLII